jgi:glycosyltransferase involved in cell wall biosynthesis
MIIGIDGNEANVEKRVGSNIYAFEIIKNLHATDPKNTYQIYLKDEPLSDFPKSSTKWHYKKIIPKKLSTQIGLPLQLFLGNPSPDIFFTPGHYAPRFSPTPTVISILDVSYLFFPEYFKKSDQTQLTLWSKYSIKNAARILTISKATRKDIIKFYNVRPDKITVTYPGFTSFTEDRDVDVHSKYGIGEKYCIFVGTLQPRKNLIRLFEAFQKIKEKNLNLVIVGKKGWLYKEIFDSVKELGLEKKVIFLDYIDRPDLYQLLKNSECFILPSLYEGFGIPVLEAMSAKTPVVVSNVSSLPEIVGDAGILVNPFEAESILRGIEKALNLDRKERNRIIEKGLERIKLFSWVECARKTLAVLEEAYNESHH